MSRIDGRILRSQKSQAIILECFIKLINKGNYYPTADEVAKESGIAIRTVFRQFADMETLLIKVDELINIEILKDEKEIRSDIPLLARVESIIN
ncbi:MAG: hypothetical protein CBD94_03875 [Gammaproteobacteria bacterium TMED234]|nr:MAG: hypothetical protein CBD94_03875 [Gammaproteobacteria bacterium TMED234]